MAIGPSQNEYDCVVMGGGPAGSTVATLVAQSGAATLLVERDKLPRFHVGESLMPETYWTLQRLGVLERLRSSCFARKVGVQFVAPSGRESQPFLFNEYDRRDCAQTWHVERAEFDMLLFDNAREQGAECQDETRVLDVGLPGTPPHAIHLRLANGSEQTITARVLVDATGQQAYLANRLGLKVDNPELHKAAIWGYYRGASRRGPEGPELTTILHTHEKRNWFWYIPLAADIVSIGLVGDNDELLRRNRHPEAVFGAEVTRCPGLQERLVGAELVGSLHVAKEFSYSTSQAAGDGWVLVGDACGFIDPIYSTGVFLALKSGEMAADAIRQAFQDDDTSAAQLGQWVRQYELGVSLFRKLVTAFYTKEFSFAQFVQAHPEHQDNLTDLLIGRAFAPGADRLFRDLDPALQRCCQQQENSAPR